MGHRPPRERPPGPTRYELLRRSYIEGKVSLPDFEVEVERLLAADQLDAPARPRGAPPPPPRPAPDSLVKLR